MKRWRKCRIACSAIVFFRDANFQFLPNLNENFKIVKIVCTKRPLLFSPFSKLNETKTASESKIVFMNQNATKLYIFLRKSYSGYIDLIRTDRNIDASTSRSKSNASIGTINLYQCALTTAHGNRGNRSTKRMLRELNWFAHYTAPTIQQQQQRQQQKNSK